MDEIPHVSKKRPATLLALCVSLWLLAALLAGYGLWLFAQPGGSTRTAVTALLVALIAFLAGVGLVRLRRWGVALFAGLTIVGSVNHIANAIQRFSTQHAGDPGAAIASMLGVLAAFLVQFVLIYWILIFWRKAR